MEERREGDPERAKGVKIGTRSRVMSKDVAKGRVSLNAEECDAKTTDRAPEEIGYRFIDVELTYETRKDDLRNTTVAMHDDLYRYGRQERDRTRNETRMNKVDSVSEGIINKMADLEQKYDMRLDKILDTATTRFNDMHVNLAVNATEIETCKEPQRQELDDKTTVKSEHITPRERCGEKFEPDG